MRVCVRVCACVCVCTHVHTCMCTSVYNIVATVHVHVDITILLVVDLCSSLVYFTTTQPLPIAGKLPIKIWVARQLPILYTCIMDVILWKTK